jgi:hypothetical protein
MQESQLPAEVVNGHRQDVVEAHHRVLVDAIARADGNMPIGVLTLGRVGDVGLAVALTLPSGNPFQISISSFSNRVHRADGARKGAIARITPLKSGTVASHPSHASPIHAAWQDRRAVWTVSARDQSPVYGRRRG